MKKHKRLLTFLKFVQYIAWFFVGYIVPFVIFADWKYLSGVIIALAVISIARDITAIIQVKHLQNDINKIETKEV